MLSSQAVDSNCDQLSQKSISPYIHACLPARHRRPRSPLSLPQAVSRHPLVRLDSLSRLCARDDNGQRSAQSSRRLPSGAARYSPSGYWPAFPQNALVAIDKAISSFLFISATGFCIGPEKLKSYIRLLLPFAFWGRRPYDLR